MGIYKWMYPPKDILLIYSDRDPDNLVNKIETRKDKYIIKDSIHCDEDSEKLQKAIKSHQAVLLCDIPSAKRNKIVKDCYLYDKRAYITPKLSGCLSLREQVRIHYLTHRFWLLKLRDLSGSRIL